MTYCQPGTFTHIPMKRFRFNSRQSPVSSQRLERFALAEHRPGHARVLGRHRHHRFPIPSPLGHALRPAAQSVCLVLARGHHRSRSQNQQGAQVTVAGFGDAPQSLFATRAVLPGHQAQPSRQLAPTFEVVPVANAGQQRTGCLGADAGHLHQLAATQAVPPP